jgi:hypothetical protein
MQVAEVPISLGNIFCHSTAGAAEDTEEEVDEGTLTMGTVGTCGTEGRNTPTE